MAITFSNPFNPLDGLEKLKIEIHKKDTYADLSSAYLVMYNPSTFSQAYKNVYDKIKVKGTQSNFKFERTEAPTLDLELLFDATGASVNSPTKPGGGGDPVDLTEEVRGKDTFGATSQLVDDLTSIKGEQHQTSYIKVIWGSFEFKGILDNVKVTHSLFKANGLPIRSKVNLTLKSHITFDEQAKETKKKSADLTKFKLVKSEDNLHLISFDNYDNSNYYLELAKVNRLNNFRALRSGTRLRLPPLEK